MGTHRGKEHSGLQERIHLALARLRKLNMVVFFQHVKGHSGDPGNDAADWVAGNALQEDPAVGEWSRVAIPRSPTQLEGDSRRPLALFFFV